MPKQLSEAQSKEFICIVVGFLDNLGLSKSSSTIKAEVREKCPDLEPSADKFQQRHAQFIDSPLTCFRLFFPVLTRIFIGMPE